VTRSLVTLRNALAVYRLAFGRARQEDAIDHLLTRLGLERAPALSPELRIDLRPPIADPAVIRSPAFRYCRSILVGGASRHSVRAAPSEAMLVA
jgi:hypothetical protein